MTDTEAGSWNFCPHCARELQEPEFVDHEFEDMVCPCCERPWIACPCTPASEGECRSVRQEESRG
jgi:hypothetical protein